jgi:hypothetical protein
VNSIQSFTPTTTLNLKSKWKNIPSLLALPFFSFVIVTIIIVIVKRGLLAMAFYNLMLEVSNILDSETTPREVKKQAWDKLRASYRKEDTYLIEHYVSDIRNRVDYWDQSFEDYEEHKRIERKRMDEIHKKVYIDKTESEPTTPRLEYRSFRDKGKPKDMTNEQYQKELKAQAKQLNKERKTDEAISHKTPWWIFHNKVNAIRCECDAEALRRGEHCKTCKLLAKVDKYMMELFKEEAEGRSPSHSLV